MKILQSVWSNPSSQIIFASRAPLLPATGGGAVRTLHIARAVSHSLKKVFIITEDQERFLTIEKGSMAIKRFPFLVEVISKALKKISKPERRLRSMELPFGESWFYLSEYDWGYTFRIAYLAIRFKVRIFQAEFPGYCGPCFFAKRLLGGVVIYGSHNVESERIKRLYPEMKESTVSFIENWDAYTPKKCDLVTAVSERDRKTFIRLGTPPEKICVVPNGIDLQDFESQPGFPLRKFYKLERSTTILVFHGAALYQPNWNAITYLATELVPGLREQHFDIVLLVVGKAPPSPPGWPHVYFTGFVKSVAPFLKAADIAVCPLDSGGGTRLKILEYFAAEIPVIATPLAVEGIPASNGNELIIAERGVETEEATKLLLSNGELSNQLTQHSRDFVKKYSWQKIHASAIDRQ